MRQPLSVRRSVCVTEACARGVDTPCVTMMSLEWATTSPFATNASLIAYCLPSNVVLMFLRAFWRLETERPTAVFRTIDPLTPVSPACSEPIAMMR
jgi:hypothetical protein